MRQTSASIRMRLDDYLTRSPSQPDAQRNDALIALLRSQAIGSEGRAFLLDETGAMIASSAPDGDAVVESAVEGLMRHTGPSGMPAAATEFRFDHVTTRPLSRETWLTYATAYRDDSRGRHWILVTAMPEAFYLAGARIGSSRSAMVFALALVLSLDAGRGTGVDGDRAAPAHFACDTGPGSRRPEHASAGQQAGGARHPRAIVQRHGWQAQDVVRRSGQRSRDAKEPRARARGKRIPSAREREPVATRRRWRRARHLGLGRGAGSAGVGRLDVPALRRQQG